MAGVVEVARRPLLIAAMVAAAGLLGLGSGPANGDAAVYAWQADNGVLTERTVHFGYIVMGWCIGSDALDVVNVLAAAGLCLGAARWAESWVAAAVVGAAVLPLASFAEVDVPWACAVSWVLASQSRWAAALWTGIAMSLSPLTVLALPWIVLTRREWPIAAAAVATVAALTIVGAGDWWIGGRGVLNPHVLLPGRTLQTWLWFTPWLALPIAVAARPKSEGLALIPLILAPPDVGGWLLGALFLGEWAARGWQDSRPGKGLLIAAAAWGLFLQNTEIRRIRAENKAIAAVVERLGPDDGLEASWSVGVRASIAAGKGPYGLRWKKPDQAWPGEPPARVYQVGSERKM